MGRDSPGPTSVAAPASRVQRQRLLATPVSRVPAAALGGSPPNSANRAAQPTAEEDEAPAVGGLQETTYSSTHSLS